MGFDHSMQFLVTVVQQLSLARDLESVMQIVRTAARELTGADGASFVLKDGDQCYYAGEDAISPLWKGLRFPMSTCISGWSMINKRSAVIPDIYVDDRIPHDAYRPTFVKSLAMVPIRKIDPIGAIGIYWATPHTPTEEEVILLQSLADITSVTMENVKVYTDLEQCVNERTAELELANQDLEAFSYSVSHDLHAPLRSVIGYLEILLEESDIKSEAATELVNKAVASARDMAQLIDDLLIFFKTGRKELAMSKVEMKLLVEEVYSKLAEQHGRKVSYVIGNLPAVNADRNLLKQVWTNLISNALKYSQKNGGAHLEIDSYDDKQFITYFIKDNGAGFDMAQAHKLFGVFQRLHSDSDYEGTGIGLAIVHKVITRHGGKVWAEGKPGQGATFYISLPKSN